MKYVLEKSPNKCSICGEFLSNTEIFLSFSDQSGVVCTDGFPSLKNMGDLPGKDVRNISGKNVDQYLSRQN